VKRKKGRKKKEKPNQAETMFLAWRKLPAV
jgi:hypothetical protein